MSSAPRTRLLKILSELLSMRIRKPTCWCGSPGRTSPTFFRQALSGFSLVELLLTVALLTLLLGAIAFNFAALGKGAALDEGSTRFATMLRYARSHAATTGRAVRLKMEPADLIAADAFFPGRAFTLQWESDPLTHPGRFQPLRLSSWDLDKLNELVAIETLEIPRPLMGRMMPTSGVASGVVVDEAIEGTELSVDPVLTFYPDGASDTARIVLVSCDGEDARQLEMRLEGLTGIIETRWIDPDPDSGGEPSEPASELATATSL
jgi:type II secretory pathway pseudopilin PulG